MSSYWDVRLLEVAVSVPIRPNARQVGDSLNAGLGGCGSR